MLWCNIYRHANSNIIRFSDCNVTYILLLKSCVRFWVEVNNNSQNKSLCICNYILQLLYVCLLFQYNTDDMSKMICVCMCI